MNYKKSQNIRYISLRTMHVKLKFERILVIVICSLIRNTPHIYISDILLEIAIRQWLWIGGFPEIDNLLFIWIYSECNISARWLDTVLCEIMTLSMTTTKKYVTDTHEGSLELKKVQQESRNLIFGVVTQCSIKNKPVLFKLSRTSNYRASVAEGRVLNTDLFRRELIQWALKILSSQFSFDIITKKRVREEILEVN